MADEEKNVTDMSEFNSLWEAVRRHPDYRGGVVWNRADIEFAAEEYGVDPEELDNNVCLDTWEDMACCDGWDHTIDQAAFELQQEKED